jgi:hypothetical protein
MNVAVQLVRPASRRTAQEHTGVLALAVTPTPADVVAGDFFARGDGGAQIGAMG